MDSPTIRIAMPLLALYVFYWGICLAPPEEDDPDPGALSFVETRKLIAKSREMIDNGQYQQALGLTMQLHNAFPRSHIHMQQLGIIYAKLGRLEEEAAILEKYLLNSPTPAEACPEIGNVYLQLRRIAKAKEAFERCYTFGDQDTDAIFFLAHFHERYGDPDRAEQLYAKGLGLSPDYPDIQLGLARMKLRRGDARMAGELSQKALRRNGKNTDALLVAGLSASSLGDAKSAREYLLKGAALSPRDNDFRAALARLAAAARRSAK